MYRSTIDRNEGNPTMLQFTFSENGMEISSYYLSDILGKKVYSKDGKLLGKVSDIIANLDYKYPEIEGIELTKSSRKSYFSIQNLDLMELARLRKLAVEQDALYELQLGERHFFVKDLLYDRQIVDVNGAKVERVNDVRILHHTGRYYVSHVDVGFTGLNRRLGFEAGVRRLARVVGKDLKDELIDWKFVQVLPQTHTGPLAVNLRQEEIKSLHAGELADILEELDRDERISLVQSIGAEDAAEALEEAHINVQASILRDLDSEFAADILEEMEPAVAADVIDRLPEEVQQSIMAAMDDEERAQIEILIHAKEDSAASLMTVDFISCPDASTVSEALELIRKYADEVDSITYVYCTDEEMHLRGVVSLRDLILSPPETVLADIMNKRLVTLSLDDDWDAVATQFMKLRFRALPVVDREGRMLGIVTFLHSFDELLPYYSRLAAA